MNRRVLFLASLITLVIFLLTRLYRLPSTLFFFNDMGRDFLVLFDWQHTGKPPLLGPQTSAIAFNQSAVYYYLLYPLYLLTGNSPFSTVYTALMWYAGLFLVGVWCLRIHSKDWVVLLMVSVLLIFQPQVYTQTRFIWNPTYTIPLILTALFLHQALRRRFTRLRALGFAIVCALMAGLNYSTVPFILVIVFSLWPVLGRRWFKLVFYGLLGGLVINLPMIVFELRHHFTLTYLFLQGQRLPQTHLTVMEKLSDLDGFIFGGPTWSGWVFLGLILVLGGLYWFRYRPGPKTKHEFYWAAGVLLALLSLTLLLPIHIEAHYIFPLLICGLWWLSRLPLRLWIIPAVFLLFIWWPVDRQVYTPVRRTVADLTRCYQAFCRLFPQPLYVSGQAGFHPYHNMPEHRYFMKQNGCRVLNIEDTQDQSQYMAVVLDDATYTQGKTAYNELTLFGSSVDTQTFTCRPNLSIHILKKL